VSPVVPTPLDESDATITDSSCCRQVVKLFMVLVSCPGNSNQMQSSFSPDLSSLLGSDTCVFADRLNPEWQPLLAAEGGAMVDLVYWR
jgi:hypothetical protein